MHFCCKWPVWRLSLALLAASVAYGQYVPNEFFDSKGSRIPYRLFVPKGYDPMARYPLVVWLHGVWGAGGDNLRQIEGSNTAGSRVWIQPGNAARHPAFVLAPQCAFGSLWINFLSRAPSRSLHLVLDLIDRLQRDYSIDPDRIYIVGQSMGAFGVWALLAERPYEFAAAIPVAGGGRTSQARRFADVPVWAFHGRLDPLVPVRESRRMIDAMKKAGGQPRYTELPERTHTSGLWDEVFSKPELLEWLFAQHRNRGATSPPFSTARPRGSGPPGSS